MAHDAEEIGFLHSREERRDMGGEGFSHLWWQDSQRIQGDQAVTVESPGRRGTAPAQLDPYEEPNKHWDGPDGPHAC